MSEYFFEYKCIATGNKALEVQGRPKNQALAFYCWQDYRYDDNSMCVQIYVPKSVQQKFAKAALYYCYDGIDFPDIDDSKLEWQIWYCGDKRTVGRDGYYIGKENSVYIREKGGTLSGCGILAFYENIDDKGAPKPTNCYKFTINFAHKETISYRIIEKEGSLTVQVVYPLIRTDIDLRILSKSGSKPVLVKDKTSQNYVTENGEPIVITLKANGRKTDVYKNSFDVSFTDKQDYRLMFEDSNNGKYYLLVDESDYTLEDKTERKRQNRTKHKAIVTTKICPYCGREFRPYNGKHIAGQTLIVDCRGLVVSRTTEEKELKGKLTYVCGANLQKLSNSGFVDGGYIDVNHMLIPEGYDRLPCIHVCMVGYPNSGKTVFLSSLFNIDDYSQNVGLKSNPHILNRIVKKFDKSRSSPKVASRIQFDNIEVDNGCTIGHSCENARGKKNGDLYKYVMGVDKYVERQTPLTEADRLSWYPVGYRMGNLGFVYFYDVPGEVFSGDAKQKPPSITKSDCFIAIIDGAPEENPVVKLQSTLKKIAEVYKVDFNENIPIAIVFTKHDLKLTAYQGDKDFCFDDNCHVVREDMLALMPSDGIYEGSELERHIDCSSYEFEHYLKENDKTTYNDIKENYKNIKFFTCSSLGSNDCFVDTDKSKKVLFKPHQLRLELPIIWLMYKKGLIKR